jgi:sortase A
MRDKRPVDELSIEELERILAIRKREARQDRMRRYEPRRVGTPPAPESASSAPDDHGEIPADVPNALSISVSVPPPEPVPVMAIPSEPAFDDEEPRFEDDSMRSARIHADPAARSLRALLWNRALLAVEIVAVGGLVYLFVTLFGAVRAVTQTTADIQAQFAATSTAQYVAPTATPAIDIAAVVLPDGHIYDAASNTARFNLNEVPAQYRDAYQTLLLNTTPQAQPTESPEAPLDIRIPAIGVDKPIVTGDTWDALQRGVGYHIGSANPGEKGNMVLSAHDDVFGEIFRDLDQLKPGDTIIVTTRLREYTYIVQSHEIVGPNDVRVMDNSRHDVQQITLITCHPYRVDTQRYVVYGLLQS